MRVRWLRWEPRAARETCRAGGREERDRERGERSTSGYIKRLESPPFIYGSYRALYTRDTVMGHSLLCRYCKLRGQCCRTSLGASRLPLPGSVTLFVVIGSGSPQSMWVSREPVFRGKLCGWWWRASGLRESTTRACPIRLSLARRASLPRRDGHENQSDHRLWGAQVLRFALAPDGATQRRKGRRDDACLPQAC
jgi:hypothetical protein